MNGLEMTTNTFIHRYIHKLKNLLFADQIKQAELPMQEKQHGKGSQPAKQHSPKAQQVAKQLIVVNTESMKNHGAEQPEEEQQCRVVIVPVVVGF